MVRALEVFFLTGRPLTAHFADTASPIPGRRRARDRRCGCRRRQISERVDAPRRRAVRRAACSTRSAALLARGVPETARPFGGLVYRQALEHLHGVRDEAATRALIAQENRRYARRQLIWFRKEPNLSWFDGPGESPRRSPPCTTARSSVESRTCSNSSERSTSTSARRRLVSHFDRAIVIVLDSVGIGELPDAAATAIEGSNTARQHRAAQVPLRLPTLRVARASDRASSAHRRRCRAPRDAAARRRSAGWPRRRPGKDSVTGHWEMMGIVLDRPFPVFPHGFSAGHHRGIRAADRPRGARQQGRVGHRRSSTSSAPSTCAPAR